MDFADGALFQVVSVRFYPSIGWSGSFMEETEAREEEMLEISGDPGKCVRSLLDVSASPASPHLPPSLFCNERHVNEI